MSNFSQNSSPTTIDTANIDDIRKLINPSYNRLCRGQSDKAWDLNCSFFRNKERKYITCEDLFGKSWNQSDENLYKTTFPPTLDNNALKLFPHLALLVLIQQNNENPTPLLDVSYDIYMPLFCACGESKENMNKDGKIFVIERTDYTGSDGNIGKSEMEILTNQVLPIFNDRMKKQAGAMLKTLNILNGKLCFCDISNAKNKKVYEYIVPKDLKPKILENLAKELNTIDLRKFFYDKNQWNEHSNYFK